MIDGGFQGNDTITSSGGSDVLIGGDGDDHVAGSRGDDVALLGDGNDVFIWNPSDSSDLVEGRQGFDGLGLNGSDASETIALSANRKPCITLSRRRWCRHRPQRRRAHRYRSHREALTRSWSTI